ncbi:MAG: UDP-2,3-diacylglucosamine diphosphatase, partial [Bacteroides sp.]
SAIYLLGDMFDFWYEFKTVVPRGYTRFLGKLSELTDRGIEVHFFIGNHDIWCSDYLIKECGLILHREPLTTEIYGKEFYLAHGDGLGDPDKSFKFMRSMFHSETMQTLFAMLHPRWSMELGLNWAKQSRLKRENGKEPDYMGEDKEYLVLYTKEYLQTHPDINFFIYGHRHIMLDLMLNRTTRMLILGDWINFFSYAVFDGVNLTLENFVEGETKQ